MMDSKDAVATDMLPAPTKRVRGRREPSAKASRLQHSSTQPLPRWIAAQEGDVAFAAGAAVFALDQVLRSDAPWLGAFRMRLALKAAVSTARLLRLSADEAGLRDALHLTRTGDDPGEAGRLHLLLRQWVSRPLHLAVEVEAGIVAVAGQGSGASELAALLAADRALAGRLGWSHALPLHTAVIHDAPLRQGFDGRRPRADEPGWAENRHAVLLRAATMAHAEAVTLARRAEVLTAAAQGLRTRDEGRGLALILADDSVAPWRMVSKNLAGKDGLGSDRAARRFCETLHGKGALRLLTDRPTFRLYGL